MSRWLPENVSTYGGQIDAIFYFIYYLTGIVFLLVAGVMLYYLAKYRDRGDGRRAIYSHGNNRLEVIWTVIPAVIFIFIGIWGEKTWAFVKKQQPPADVLVRVRAKQFNWALTYAGPDGKLDTPDDYQTENRLRVPVNKVVVMMLESEDVIHSLFLPNLRFKQDMLPGRTIPGWFEATKPGEYDIACAELCGFGHTTMAGKLLVLDDAAWQEWVSKRWPAGT